MASGSFHGGAHQRLLPVQDRPVVDVTERSGGDHDDVDDPPDAKASCREQPDDSGADLDRIEPMDTEPSQEYAQQQGRRAVLVTDGRLSEGLLVAGLALRRRLGASCCGGSLGTCRRAHGDEMGGNCGSHCRRWTLALIHPGSISGPWARSRTTSAVGRPPVTSARRAAPACAGSPPCDIGTVRPAGGPARRRGSPRRSPAWSVPGGRTTVRRAGTREEGAGRVRAGRRAPRFGC